MPVPSYAFLAFAAVVALIVNLSSAPRWRRGVLVAANLGFIATFTRDPVQLAPFAGLLALGFVGIKVLERNKRRGLFAVFVVAVLVVFCWLKRYTFIPHALFLPNAYLTVGMSYVFFRIMHLVIDSYEDTLGERIGIVRYVSFTLNFTSFVSGPIQLYRDYRRTESERPAPLDQAAVGAALERIVLGFFKVAVLSPVLFFYQHGALGALAASPALAERVLFAAVGFGLYPVYLYFNFSGYTDFVIGAARFLRLELPENFDRPFLAFGYLDFWARWHMTLSNWLKTYVYSPLMMSLMRRYPARQVEPYLGVFAFFVTFFLIGAWHGQTTMFLFFGVLQGAGVSANKLYQIVMIRRLGRPAYRALCARPAYAMLSRGLTFTYYALSLLWFWSSWAELGRFASLLGPGGTVAAFALLLLCASVLLALYAVADEALRPGAGAAGRLFASRYARAAWSAVLLTATVSVTVVLNAPAPSIVYRAF